jgi:hypothetical protein
MNASSLYYRNGDEWLPLPYWAQFLADLGSAIAAGTVPGKRTVTGREADVEA